MTTLWIIEDHKAFARSLQRLISAEAQWHCEPPFHQCESALRQLRHGGAPELILIDIGLPGMSGIEGIQAIRRLAPDTLILVLTSFEEDDKIVAAICAGATGYLLKTAGGDEILAAIQNALDGGSPMTSSIARRVLGLFARMAPAPRESGLSERETQILKLMVQGLLKKEIAHQLELSIHTVDTYLRRIYEKLQVNSRSSAVAKALKEGIV
jgi:DNA-binding NarL/FixJ family response regulator